MPNRGPLVVDVPGVVEGWHQLLTRFGTIDLGAAIEPAIAFARDGFPVAELIANEWHDNLPTPGRGSRHGSHVPAEGRAAEARRDFRESAARRVAGRRSRAKAATPSTGDRSRARSSPTCKRATVCSSCATSPITQADWVEPIATNYRGYDLLEMPPSTQGFVALEMLNIMEGFDIGALGHNSADYLHVVSEAKRIAFADRGALLADRDHMPTGALQRLISKEYAASRRQRDRA